MNEDRIYDQGRKASRDGRPLSACPYDEFDERHVEWELGWRDGMQSPPPKDAA